MPKPVRLDCPTVPNREALRDAACRAAGPGDWAEFGVHTGIGARSLLRRMPHGISLHLFDSWSGSPEPWDRGDKIIPAGSWACERPAIDDDRAVFHEGWFDQTAPQFVANHLEDQLGLVSFDCDSYASTSTALEAMESLVGSGTVLVFWVMLSHPKWNEHQWQAWQEFSEAREYEWVAQTPSGQVAVRMQA